MPNTTPDLLLATTAKPSMPGVGREIPPSKVSRNKVLEPNGIEVTVGITASASISVPQDRPGSPSGHEDSAPELRASFLPRTLSLRNSISKSESGVVGREWEVAL